MACHFYMAAAKSSLEWLRERLQWLWHKGNIQFTQINDKANLHNHRLKVGSNNKI